MLKTLAFLTLVLAVGAQVPKHAKKSRKSSKPSAAAASPALGATPSPSAVTPDGFMVIRTADCVLALKGQLVRQMSMFPARGKPSQQSKPGDASEEKNPIATSSRGAINGHTLEHFDYELPGTIAEEVEPKGTRVRFRFTPGKDVNAGAAQAKLHLEDQTKGPAFPPTVVDAIEVLGADPFVFEAAARGQQLVPVSGMVILKGQLQNAPSAPLVSMKAPLGPPVYSYPLPSQPLAQDGSSRASLQFVGISLWAWPNSRNSFTADSTIIYGAPGSQGRITGSVNVTFRVGATR